MQRRQGIRKAWLLLMKNSLKSAKEVIQKLMYILSGEQKRYGMLVLIVSFVGALLETLGVSAIIPLINALITPEVILENELAGNIMRFLNIRETGQVVLLIGGTTIFLYIMKNLFFIFLSWLRAKYACKVQRELSVHMMKTYMDKGYSFFLTRNTSELMRGVFADTNGVYSLLNQFFKIIVECMTVVLICLYILLTDWGMAVGIAVLACICLIIIYGYFRGKMKKLGRQSRKYGAIVNQQAIQAFQGIKEVIVMRKQKYFVRNFEDACIKQQQASVGHTVGTESPGYIIEAICITGLLGMICIRVVFGSEDASAMLPALSAFAVGAFRILPALGKISSSFNTMIFYIPSLNEMYEKLRETEREDDTLRNIYGVEKCTETRGFKNELDIDKIYWKYSEGSDYVLKALSLKIRKGESVALIGQSGAGKTTLADIILGLLKPQSGQVKIDGKDIFSIGDEWSNIIGYVPQSVYLTDDSIRKNIAFGVREEEIEDEKIWNALEQAQLKEFVESLGTQLDTLVGERGVRFSGGQRQRVAIARALYKNPNILILDEATAALDSDTESAVMQAIEALKGKITLIIIAHRLSTIRKCDRIYEVKDGDIWEREKVSIFDEKSYEEE